jgi:quercetin dioxygenase-like cupin family protein
MKQPIMLACTLAAGILVGSLSIDFVHAQGPLYETKQVLRTDLKDLPGEELLIFSSTWQPGARLPLHMHPDGHEVTFVVEGEQTFEVGGRDTVVAAGQALYTPPNTPHFGRNATDHVSRTIVVRIKRKDQPISVDVKR